MTTAVAQRSFAAVVGDAHAQPFPTEVDEDYMLALQLQEQFEVEEALARTGLPVKMHLGSGNSGTANAGRRVYSGDDAEDEYYDEDEDEEAVKKHKNVMTSAGPTKQHHQVVKTQGRQPRPSTGMTKKVVSTKHDPEKAGRKNAERLQNQWYMQAVKGGPLPDDSKIPTPVFNSLKEHSRRTTNAAARRKEMGEDAATHEQVLDKRTRVMLHKLVSSGVLAEMNGCIATGKESCVYHAVLVAQANAPAETDAAPEAAASAAPASATAVSAPAPVKPAAAASPEEPEERKVDVVVKIMRTTLSEFKNRTSYMPSKLSRQNPRKLIRLWAEKVRYTC